MIRANRWFLYGPFLVAGAALVLWFFLWRAGADAMRRGLADLAATAAADGVAISHAPLRPRGFPFFLRGAAEDFTIIAGAHRFECDVLYLDALAYALDRVIFSCGGDPRLDVGEDRWTISAPAARASIERDKDRAWLIRAETGVLAATGGAAAIRIAAATLNIRPARDAPAALEASLALRGLAADEGPMIERLDAAARLSPPQAAGAPHRLDIYGAELVIDESVLRAAGPLALTADGAVAGSLDAELEKPVGLARALGAAALLAPDEQKAAEAGLAMLAVASGGVIRAPIDFEKDGVRLAGVRVARRSQP